MYIASDRLFRNRMINFQQDRYWQTYYVWSELVHDCKKLHLPSSNLCRLFFFSVLFRRGKFLAILRTKHPYALHKYRELLTRPCSPSV